MKKVVREVLKKMNPERLVKELQPIGKPGHQLVYLDDVCDLLRRRLMEVYEADDK